jgi:hypothetical protein
VVVSELRKTEDLERGDVVLTANVFDNFVTLTLSPGHPTAAWRTVEDIATVPRDRKADPDRLVFFRDGTKAFTQTGRSWKRASGWSKP